MFLRCVIINVMMKSVALLAYDLEFDGATASNVINADILRVIKISKNFHSAG